MTIFTLHSISGFFFEIIHVHFRKWRRYLLFWIIIYRMVLILAGGEEVVTKNRWMGCIISEKWRNISDGSKFNIFAKHFKLLRELCLVKCIVKYLLMRLNSLRKECLINRHSFTLIRETTIRKQVVLVVLLILLLWKSSLGHKLRILSCTQTMQITALYPKYKLIFIKKFYQNMAIPKCLNTFFFKFLG